MPAQPIPPRSALFAARAATLLLALAQIPLGALHAWAEIGQPISAIARIDGVRPLQNPAAYAFAIWSPIFLAHIALAGWSVLRPGPIAAALGWLPALAYALGGAWMVLAQTVGDGPHLAALIVLYWAAAVAGLARARDAVDGRLARAAFGLLAGWLSLAMTLNIASAATRAWPEAAAALGAEPVALLVLVCGFATAFGVAWGLRSPWAAGAAVWGLVGVVAANVAGLAATTGADLSGSAMTAGAAVAGALALFLLGVRLLTEPEPSRSVLLP